MLQTIYLLQTYNLLQPNAETCQPVSVLAAVGSAEVKTITVFGTHCFPDLRRSLLKKDYLQMPLKLALHRAFQKKDWQDLFFQRQ